MPRLFAGMALAALALGGCTPTAEMQASQRARADRELAEALKGRVPGKPVSCVRADRVNGPQVIDDNTILYRESGVRVWRNDLPDGCPSLHGDPLLVLELHGSEICENDIFRVVDRASSMPMGSCRFGKWTPYSKAGR